MTLLVIGGIAALVTLLVLLDVIAKILDMSTQKQLAPAFRTEKRFPFGQAFFTLLLIGVSAFLLVRGLKQTAFSPYQRARRDRVTITNEDKHLRVQVWLKKDKADLEDNVRMVVKASAGGALAIGIAEVDIESDAPGVDKVVRGRGAWWGSSLGRVMGMSPYQRDEQEILFSADRLYRTPISVHMTVGYELAQGSGPSFFENRRVRSEIDIEISASDEP